MLIVALAPVCTLAASEALCHLGPRDAAFNATATSRPPGAWACHGLAWLGGGASTCLVEPEAEAEDSHDARIGLSRLKAALASETDGKHGKAFWCLGKDAELGVGKPGAELEEEDGQSNGMPWPCSSCGRRRRRRVMGRRGGRAPAGCGRLLTFRGGTGAF